MFSVSQGQEFTPQIILSLSIMYILGSEIETLFESIVMHTHTLYDYSNH